MTSQCDYLLLRCMDFRLERAVEAWLRPYLGRTDVISIAGSCKVLAEAPESGPALFIWDNIRLAYEHHGVRRVILTQHQDCGGYGGGGAFGSAEAEKTRLLSDMQQVKENLRRRYPDLQVATYWIRQTGEGWEFEAVDGGAVK
jgi:carbonic anhydrase